ncbi:hypothetical protein PVK06_034314 [Gossypium arboreum]|uniref:non-specific serine/threonine protein kinase n=1 Tax=Gossypium arboreum TaxID=29729 RepID=A0ABR0NET3_GOSAR|nr:hypothetical protein PVK06_034314 [Gossypium arboreum]
MESLVISSPKSQNPGSGIANSSSASTSGTLSSSRPPSPKQSGNEGPSSTSHGTTLSQGIRIIRHPNGSIGYQKHPCKTAYDNLQDEELPNMAKLYYDPSKGKSGSVGKDEVLISTQMKVLTVESISSSFKHPIGDHMSLNSSGSLESENVLPGSCKGGVVQLNNHTGSEHEPNFCPSPSHSVCTGTNYTEAKPSFTNTEISNSCDVVESRKTSMYRGSTGSDVSDESGSSCLSSAIYKPHKANDIRWEAIQAVRSRKGDLDFKHFRVLRRLGCGDIGSVYLSELTLYTHFETEKLSCLVMEFCPGGDLHALRQRQPGKHFSEQGARFYVAEVLLALEYLHMLGIIYRDLKPENVLVREDGHIMLSDFDLSLRCAVSPTLVKSSNTTLESKHSSYCAQPACIEPTCVVQPDCIQPACFGPRFFSSKPKKEKKNKVKNETGHQVSPLPELIAEPTNARSMSFVGTHEYLAPEIIKGEGHGSAVDWWTFGIFLYELLFGKTPFKGNGNRATLFNVVGQPLRFPEYPNVSFAARDLIRGLLVKEPQHRLAYRRGATEVKQHPFFQSVNWALIRCANPPEVPKQAMMETPMNNKGPGLDVKPSDL